MLLSWLDIIVITMVCSLFLDVAKITALSAVFTLVQMLKGGILLYATLTPFVYLALRAKGSIAPFIRFPGSRSLSVDCLIPAAHRQSFAVRSIFRARRTHYFARIRIRHMRQYNKISKGRHHLKKKLPASIHGNLIEIRK